MFFRTSQLVPLPFSCGRCTRYSDGLHDFSVTIPRCSKDFYVNSFFPLTAGLWNSLPIECFLLTYDLSGFMPRINRHILICRFSLNRFSVIFLCFFSWNSMHRSGSPALHGVNPNLKKE